MSLPSNEHIAGLYTRFGAALTRAGRRILRDAAEVDDVVQEAFCHYCEHASGLREPAAAFAYLKRSVMNLCFNRIKGGRAEATDPTDALFAALPAPDRSGQSEARNRLSLLLAGMDEEMLSIGALYHLDGLTQEEIAEALDLSRRTVGKKLAVFDERVQKRAARLEGEGG
ncbi:MAG: sigma-70 family RNA polymerase sigma factor [Deltaproteobacteria bacterium]|nr:sigma-70 family RNA polymerase sigma factor [Deltaproteobacteria bacterium]